MIDINQLEYWCFLSIPAVYWIPILMHLNICVNLLILLSCFVISFFLLFIRYLVSYVDYILIWLRYFCFVYKNIRRVMLERRFKIIANGTFIIRVLAPHIIAASDIFISCFTPYDQPEVIWTEAKQGWAHHCWEDGSDPAWEVN